MSTFTGGCSVGTSLAKTTNLTQTALFLRPYSTSTFQFYIYQNFYHGETGWMSFDFCPDI